MADVATNRGAFLFQLRKFRPAASGWQRFDGSNRAAPTNYYLALCTAANTPSKDTNTLDELVQVVGGGYVAGGYIVPCTSTGFPTVLEDDALDKSVVTMADQTITAVGSDIPTFAWVVMVDDDATAAKRQVLGAWAVSPPVSIPNGTTKVLQAGKLEDAPV